MINLCLAVESSKARAAHAHEATSGAVVDALASVAARQRGARSGAESEGSSLARARSLLGVPEEIVGALVNGELELAGAVQEDVGVRAGQLEVVNIVGQVDLGARVGNDVTAIQANASARASTKVAVHLVHTSTTANSASSVSF